MANDTFEPEIVGILCNWCTYAGADLAGTSRLEYPPNIKSIRVMCTGRVDPLFIVKSLKEGADGVFISGCHLGDCHYQSGNYKSVRRVLLLKRMLEDLGINPDRIAFEHISASEGQKFARKVTTFTNRLKELGPNPLKEEELEEEAYVEPEEASAPEAIPETAVPEEAPAPEVIPMLEKTPTAAVIVASDKPPVPEEKAPAPEDHTFHHKVKRFIHKITGRGSSLKEGEE